MNKKDKILVSNTFMLYIMKFSTMIFPLITLPYLTRILELEIYSAVTFVNSFITYFLLILDFGFDLSATKDISKNRENTEEVNVILTSVIISKLILGILSFLAVILIGLMVQNLRNHFAFLMLSYTATFLTVFIPTFYFRGIEQMKVITIRYLITKSIFTALMFILVKKPEHYLFIPILNVLGDIISIVISWYYIYKKTNNRVKKVKLKDVLINTKKSSLFFYSRIASTVYGSSNTFVLGFYYPTTVGLFSVAYAIVQTIRGLYGPLADSLYPYMIRNRNFYMIKKILIIFMPLVIIGSIVLFIFAEFFIKLFAGSMFIGSASLLKFMVPLLIISLPIYILGFPTLGPLGMDKKANHSVIYSSIFHFIGLAFLMLTKTITMEKVAILTIFSETIVLVLRVYYILNYKYKWRKFNG